MRQEKIVDILRQVHAITQGDSQLRYHGFWDYVEKAMLNETLKIDVKGVIEGFKITGESFNISITGLSGFLGQIKKNAPIRVGIETGQAWDVSSLACPDLTKL